MTKTIAYQLGSLAPEFEKTLEKLHQEDLIPRLWKRDHTLWKNDPTEIADRLDWLDSPYEMKSRLEEIRTVVDSLRGQDYTDVLLMGMGGSSLAPEVFRYTFGVAKGYPDLAILDTTDPEAIQMHTRRLNPTRTLFIVASKFGGTVETISLLHYFYSLTAQELGPDTAGEHFIAITDPGSSLAELAVSLKFRHVFLNNPAIGGRYSALSFFGLVAAGLIGVDLNRLLERARQSAADPAPGVRLGAILGTAAPAGHDKLTLICSPPIASFGAWVEQLVAESTGKEGKGILPIDGEPLIEPESYATDRLFIYLRLKGDSTRDDFVQALAAAGHPVVRLELEDLYDLGGQFFLWQMATAVAGHLLQINPFDQPDVETAKRLTRELVQQYRQQKKLPDGNGPALREGGLTLYGDLARDTLCETLLNFLRRRQIGRSYLALQAYLRPDPQLDTSLQELRKIMLIRTHLATTLGYGPRFLHSTGQLHKGDAGNGLFIQLTADSAVDIAIPDLPGTTTSNISFGILKATQALGDFQALRDAGRPVLRIHMGTDIRSGIEQLKEACFSCFPVKVVGLTENQGEKWTANMRMISNRAAS